MKGALADELIGRFSRVAEKYRSIEKTPLMLPSGIKVYGAEMHMAVAIGEGRASTATELAALFGITKGAVSQAIKKLESKGLLKRERTAGDEKRWMLSLTGDGWELVKLHERLHGVNKPLFDSILKRYTLQRMREIKRFLDDVEELLDVISTGREAPPSAGPSAGGKRP